MSAARGRYGVGIGACLVLGTMDLGVLNMWLVPAALAPAAVTPPAMVQAAPTSPASEQISPPSAIAQQTAAPPAAHPTADPASALAPPVTSAAASAQAVAVAAAAAPQTAPKPAASSCDESTPPVVIRFATNSAAPSDEAEIDRVLSLLATNPGCSLTLDGHTDTRGEPSYNDALGASRAQAISARLQKRGVARGRIIVHSSGSRSLLATGNDETAHSQNRRVEVRFGRSHQ